MEPKYKTTVAKMLEHTEKLLDSYEVDKKNVRLAFKSGEISADQCYHASYFPLEVQYRKNLSYLKGCESSEEVTLTREEWELYFNGKEVNKVSDC